MIQKKIAEIEEKIDDTNKKNFLSLKRHEKKIVGYLGIIKSDYIAFALGFVSAIVVDEFMGIFKKTISDNWLDFILSICNVCLLGASCLFCLIFSTSFTELQSLFDSYPTSTAGYNAILSDFTNTKETIKKIWRYLKWSVAMGIIAFLVNITFFIYINISH